MLTFRTEEGEATSRGVLNFYCAFCHERERRFMCYNHRFSSFVVAAKMNEKCVYLSERAQNKVVKKLLCLL